MRQRGNLWKNRLIFIWQTTLGATVIMTRSVVAAGDVHHFEGVRSVQDPLWMTNYELIYSHPDLMLPWYPILGNHEYRGNTQAVLDYSK